jgi:hypothetical protein
MKTLEKVINEMARKQFDLDSAIYSEFMFKHAKIGEFVEYLEKKEGVCYLSTRLKNMQGLASSFNSDVLWVRMKDDYIAAVVKMLESKLDPTIEININYGN